MNSNCSQYSTTYWFTCLTTPTQTVYADCNGNASATFDGSVQWGTTTGVGSEGAENGDAEIHWSVNGTAETGFYFNIGGDNVPGDVSEAGLGESVEQFYQGQGAPWFWGNLLALESSGEQYCDGQSYCSTPYPLVHNNPDGIGISQVDGSQNPSYVSDSVYWNVEGNIEAGLNILNSKKTESQNSWTSNYANSGDVDPSSYDHNNPYTYCHFVTNTEPLGNHSFGDANWIQDYNSHSGGYYYLWWLAGKGWQFKYNYSSQAGYNYVPSVCNKAPY